MAYSDVGIGDVLNGLNIRQSFRPQDNVEEFHKTFTPNAENDDVLDKIERRMKLVAEEFEEVMEALKHLHRTELGYTSYTPEEALTEVAAELGDLLYVTFGTAVELDIPLQEVFNEIHQANMRKVWDDGEVHRNDYGKVIKPPNHRKADIRKVMYGESDNTEEG